MKISVPKTKSLTRQMVPYLKNTLTETLKDLAKVSKPRSFETEMSISAAGLPNYSFFAIFELRKQIFILNEASIHTFGSQKLNYAWSLES